MHPGATTTSPLSTLARCHLTHSDLGPNTAFSFANASVRHACATYQKTASIQPRSTRQDQDSETHEVLSPSRLFAAALDELLTTLVEQNDIKWDNLAAISGCGQQHGSVFWTKGTESLLRNLDPDATLKDQLESAFAIENAPIWMDSSTTEYCRCLEDHVGGPHALANLTGSRAYERFTGNQIAKIIDTKPFQFESCERISLISSMITSLLAGKYSGIDYSDASGMNLLDIHLKDWPATLLSCVAGKNTSAHHLKALLGAPTAPHFPISTISPYFVERYGFSPTCKVIPFTGDNPSTLAGLGISAPGDLAISLGTSDTAFAVVNRSDCRPSGEEGHVLINPVDPDSFIVMLCFKNGSLAREAVRKQCCPTDTWQEFDTVLSKTPIGNTHHIGFFHPEPEITPTTHLPTSHIFPPSSPSPEPPSAFSPAVQIRAIVETHCLRLRHHTRLLGVSGIKRILVSGGASANRQILATLANVFQVPVYTVKDETIKGNAAAYGGVLRAIHGLECERQGKFVMYAPKIEVEVCARPDEGAGVVYDEMLERFGVLERKSVQLSQSAKLW
ncbi:UNVERIFIED_CONTAM: hypothetical protein HDU68_004251 [Siphonaria sp. JEL0065]|nr:hypothetical protein HDU68_004251 [Siphonaria sp. JEL0065]